MFYSQIREKAGKSRAQNRKPRQKAEGTASGTETKQKIQAAVRQNKVTYHLIRDCFTLLMFCIDIYLILYELSFTMMSSWRILSEESLALLVVSLLPCHFRI